MGGRTVGAYGGQPGSRPSTGVLTNELSTRQKVGIALAGLYGATNIPSAFTPTPEGGDGPPLMVLVVDSALGVIALVAAVIAWRTGSGAAIRVAAGALIIIAITALPAFFVDVPSWVKLLVAGSTLLTIATWCCCSRRHGAR